jgi:hypothetical protein
MPDRAASNPDCSPQASPLSLPEIKNDAAVRLCVCLASDLSSIYSETLLVHFCWWEGRRERSPRLQGQLIHFPDR